MYKADRGYSHVLDNGVMEEMVKMPINTSLWAIKCH